MELNKKLTISKVYGNETPRLRSRKLYETIDNIFLNKLVRNISITEQERVFNQKISEQLIIKKAFSRQAKNYCQFKRSLVQKGNGMTVQSNVFYFEDNSHRQFNTGNKSSFREPIQQILKTQPSEDNQPQFYSITNQITRTKSKQLLKRLKIEKEKSQLTQSKSMFPILINSVLQ